jgi:hypothetical protein
VAESGEVSSSASDYINALVKRFDLDPSSSWLKQGPLVGFGEIARPGKRAHRPIPGNLAWSRITRSMGMHRLPWMRAPLDEEQRDKRSRPHGRVVSREEKSPNIGRNRPYHRRW